MNKAVKQYTFPPLLERRGKEYYGVNEIDLRAKTDAYRKVVERRYAQALGFKIDNPDASRYAVAKHLRETVWPEASQGTVEGAIRTWENAPHWRSYIPT